MIAVTFALPQESRAFRRAMRKTRPSSAGPFVIGELGRREVVVAHTGVGLAAAEHTTGALLRAHGPTLLVAAGFAGALDRGLALGDLVVATNFSAPALVESSLPVAEARSFFGKLTSQSFPIESVADKVALARKSGALAVDMETEAIAGVCSASRVPMLAVRAISDTAQDALPVPFDEWFDLEKQGPRPGQLGKFLLRNPRQLLPFARFVTGLPRARRELTAFLVRYLAALPDSAAATPSKVTGSGTR